MNATSSARVPILDAARIERKLLRMAWQIWEHNSGFETITLIGIADAGLTIANRLADHLKAISPLQVSILRLDIDKRSPAAAAVKTSGAIADKSLVLVDDVANSGKTLLYALRPLMDAAPEKILIAVLVDRKHKSYPVTPDIIGHKIATTIQENIVVTFEGGQMAAYLE